MLKRALFLSLIALSTLAASGEPAPPPVPTEVRDASSRIRVWLDSFRGKSEADVAAVIGNDYQKDTWTFQGKAELKIRLKFDKESTLILLFYGEKVVKAEIYVMSDDAD